MSVEARVAVWSVVCMVFGGMVSAAFSDWLDRRRSGKPRDRDVAWIGKK